MMKKLLFAAVVFALFCNNATAADNDLELISEEMLLSGEAGTQDLEEEEDNKEPKKGFFGFIGRFFGFGNEETDEVKETFIEKNTRLAESGNVDAQMNLAYMYLYGTNGVEADYAKSVQYYQMAAEQKDPIALNNLGSLYFNGIGVEKNIRSALELFEQSAELGNENAAINLAFIYLTGGKKDDARNRKAVELLQKAQEKSNIAKFMLGYAYYQGFVVEKNYEKAFKLINAAASETSQIDEAQLILASMYRDGYGTVQNYQSAVELYRAAARQGNIEAIMTLADIYKEGKISVTNLAMAHALYNIAAARGVTGAAELRDNLAETSKLKLEVLTQAQSIAKEYKATPSELTNYIRQTYGTEIRSYIDKNMPAQSNQIGK